MEAYERKEVEVPRAGDMQRQAPTQEVPEMQPMPNGPVRQENIDRGGVSRYDGIGGSENADIEARKGTLSNYEARKWYLEQETTIPNRIDKNLSLEEQAKQAFNLRNQFRTQARELMADRALAESLNETDPNFTWEKMVKKQINKGLEGDEIYKEIIRSSQRSRKDANKKLGLE